MEYAPLMKKAHRLVGGDYVDFLNRALAHHTRLGAAEFERRYDGNPAALVKGLGIPLRERLNKKRKTPKRYG